MWWTMVPWKKLIPVAIGVVAAVAVLTYISYLHIAIDLANGKREVAEELERDLGQLRSDHGLQQTNVE